jgi:hypothetical protein
MKLTISAIAIASAVFAGTFVFAPAVAEVGQRLSFDPFLNTQPSAPVTVATQEPTCSTPVAMIVDALSTKDCF